MGAAGVLSIPATPQECATEEPGTASPPRGAGGTPRRARAETESVCPTGQGGGLTPLFAV